MQSGIVTNLVSANIGEPQQRAESVKSPLAIANKTSENRDHLKIMQILIVVRSAGGVSE